MKGNETRVVIFLQPVNPPKEGQVSTLKQRKLSPFGLCALFLVFVLILCPGVLVFISDVTLGTESTTFSINVDPTKWLYALVAFSSLLLVYLALFLAARLDLKERTQKAWSRLRGRLPRNTRILLQTLPYYLAVTRSTCEVI